MRGTVRLSLKAGPRISATIELALAATAAAIMLLAGCGGNSSTSSGSSGGSNQSGNVRSGSAVTIYPATVSVPINGTIQFSAYLPSQPSSTFSWSVSGGGAIDSSTGIYTAPGSPASVTVTATSQGSANSTGTATITVTAPQGVLVSPAAVAISAGAAQTFSATVNGQAATGVTWEVHGTTGGDEVYGTIDSNGYYTAPLTPPPGGSAVITAVTGTGSAAVSGTTTAAVVFSNASLNSHYAFSYKGNDSSGFLGVAGSFTAQGSAGSSGQILNGVEDSIDAGTGAATHNQFSGTFTVNPDGRTTATLTNNVTWQFTLLSNPEGGAAREALLIRFDKSATGSGTIEAQNPALLAASAFFGNYAFGLSGMDGNGKPLAIAGRFYADGVTTIPLGSAIQDVNDNGSTTLSTTTTSGAVGDKSLQGSFLMDATLPDSGRGTVSLTSDNAVFAASLTLQFAFYMVDNTHLKVVEIDNKAALAGDFYSAVTPADGAFTAALALPKGNYAFTASGISAEGAYASGGVFNSNGTNAITGVFDVNNGTTDVHLNGSLTGSSYTVDSYSGRVAVVLIVNGAQVNFIGYPVAFSGPSGPVRMLELIELDKTTIATGIALPQTSTNSLQGNYALNLAGIPGPNNGANEQDVIGQITTLGNTSFSGTLDINNFTLTTTTLAAPLTNATAIVTTTSNGRDTATMATNADSFSLTYYIVDDNNALLLETDGARVTTGLVSRQF